MHQARSRALDLALSAFPPPIADQLRALATASGTCAVISSHNVSAWTQRLGITVEQLMLRLVAWAAAFADPVISNYSVGAVARGRSGALYPGANLEFRGQALSFSVHAEQSAITSAWVHGEAGLLALAVSAAPCGHCRQFLYELVGADQLRILLPGTLPLALSSLLPNAFGPGDLGVQGGLMQPSSQGLVLEQASTDAVVLAALAAANASYAPYSGSYSGVALQVGDGSIYDGRYAENAAFNPSMSPLAAALAHLALCEPPDHATITKAVLVESAGPISQRAAAIAVLGAVSDTPLDYARVVTA